MKSLILTGPESSGKSTLAQHISKLLEIKMISEYSRTYLGQTNGKYNYEDIAIMARNAHSDLASYSDSRLILDTDILTYKVWSDFKYQKTDDWINDHLKDNNDKLYLLCYPDIDWSPDPLRENPHDRLALFAEYEALLQSLNLRYFIICGKNSRLSTGLELATNYFNL